MYKHFLIATDGSDVAQRGVDHGLALAKQLGAKVTVLVVSEVITGNVLAGQPETGLFTRTEELQRSAEVAAKKILGSVGEQAAAAGVACELVHLRDIMPSQGILETTEKNNCDLIVMGSHGWSGIARLFLGSQAVEVVTGAKVPVLIVR